ncbi:DUF357 domain-containing protein [Candidatus Pacearchaeota archaeon]|nr:DUF357 domain-containing protein [Candidatus Pacearchaeota archaeon]
MENEISREKLDRYFDLTSRGLVEVKKNVIKGKDSEAGEIIEMVSNYLSDARHFEKKGDWVSAFAALNYAHGWLDCGVRIGVFDVNDRELFTVC